MRATVIRRLKCDLGLAQKRQVMGVVKACVRELLGYLSLTEQRPD